MLYKLALSVMLVLATAANTSASPPAATGRLRLRFTEHSPLSAQEEVLRRFGAKVAAAPDLAHTADFDLAAEPFDVYVSPNYKPDVPQGIFVWVGVTEASPAWLDVLARHKLIFISATPSGANVRNIWVRKPIDGVHNLKQRYNVDDKRVYVCGFSAGADIASLAICAFPDVFQGAFLMMGGGFYPRGAIDDNGGYAPTVASRLIWQGELDEIKQSHALVLMRGQNEPYWKMSIADYEGLVLDGFVRASFIAIPGVGHNHPDARWFEKAIDAIDRPEIRRAPTTIPTTDRHPLPGQIAQAKRYIASAEHRLPKSFWNKPGNNDARTQACDYLRAVIELYPTTPSAAKARQMLNKLVEPTTRPGKPSANE